jgi:hypothetical protein
LTLALAIPGAGTADDWVRDEAGRCEREWTPGSLARGPAAVANGLMLPFRSLAGSFTDGVSGALLSPLALAVGTAEGIVWIFQGFADTLTGGSLGIAPHGATTLRLRPVLQLPPGERDLDEYREDRCQPGAFAEEARPLSLEAQTPAAGGQEAVSGPSR